MPEKYIQIKGAREHNLKNIDVKIPIDKLTVITGLSGSGKSSLAFDTLYAEGQRRYVESLSAYARQFLGVMNKPDVDKITGLSPAISIEQKSVSKSPRSTVGTVTEIYDYLRLLFARIGEPHCPRCGRKISTQSAESIVDSMTKEFSGLRAEILSPIARGKKGTFENQFKNLLKDGYSKIRVDNLIYDLEDYHKIKLEKNIKHNIEVIVDMIMVKKETTGRLTEAVENSLNLSDGLVMAVLKNEQKMYSDKNACPVCEISFEELQPRMFSFNSPFGACQKCHGLGIYQEFDEDLIVPEKNLSIIEGAIKPWRAYGEGWRQKMLESVAQHYKFDLWTPWKKLPENIKEIILYGAEDEIRFDLSSRIRDSKYSWTGSFEGIIPQLQRLYKQTESEYRRLEISKYLQEGVCPDCQGKRLKPEVLAVKISGLNIWQATEMSIEKFFKFINNLDLAKRDQEVADLVLKEIKSRLQFLIGVGLEYLTLSRLAGTLSGGEAQRIRLATQVGSELRGVLYVLDEPSVGLHQRDNKKLIETLINLKNLGNTVVVVEHDAETILAADYVVDLGPGAGIHGGKVVCAGTAKKIIKCPHSITGRYLSNKMQIKNNGTRRKAFEYLEVIGASQHNLKGIDVKFPLGIICAVSGVSGSGKSTLVNDILYNALHKIFVGSGDIPGKHKALKGYGNIDKAVIVDQSPIGRTPRSNPATYIGVFTAIREIFANTIDARKRGYKPGRFSFNVPGGRCEECEGDGVKKIEMHFLPDIYIECEKCKGKRYNSETLNIKYKEKNIADVLKMTVEEALSFFANIPAISYKLKTLNDVGLSYLELGQPAPTLSGGEAQRVKLTTELSRKGGKVLYILDEPTTGLHFDDIKKLLEALNRLVDKGNSVIIIEHNLDVLKSVDWIIDMGPEGGEKGGRVITEGTPEKIAKCAKWSYTGKYLKNVLKIGDQNKCRL